MRYNDITGGIVPIRAQIIFCQQISTSLQGAVEQCPEGTSSHETTGSISLKAEITSTRTRAGSHETAIVEPLPSTGNDWPHPLTMPTNYCCSHYMMMLSC